MADALRMGCVQGIRDLDTQIEHRFSLQRLACDPMSERLTFEQLHRDERPILNLVDFVNRADVRMVEGRRRFGLSLETAEHLWISRDIIGQEFESDETVQLDVLRFIDDTHSPTAELLDDAIVRDGLADHSG